MCRLFGMLSVNAVDASKYLLSDPCSIYFQSNVDQKRLQSDGWGIGFYADGNPHLIRSGKPIYEEQAKFASIARKVRSRIIITHIRRASNPRELPKEKIISVKNSQPFRHDSYMFAHNGVVAIPDEVAEKLGSWKHRIKSFNDSEVYFWFIVKELTMGASFTEALEKFEECLSELWQKNRRKYPNMTRPYMGLNVLFSDGNRLYAYCKFHEQDEAVRSLCFNDEPVFQMSYMFKPTMLVIASERTNLEKKWMPLKSGQLLIGQIKGKSIEMNLQKIY